MSIKHNADTASAHSIYTGYSGLVTPSVTALSFFHCEEEALLPHLLPTEESVYFNKPPLTPLYSNSEVWIIEDEKA